MRAEHQLREKDCIVDVEWDFSLINEDGLQPDKDDLDADDMLPEMVKRMRSSRDQIGDTHCVARDRRRNDGLE